MNVVFRQLGWLLLVFALVVGSGCTLTPFCEVPEYAQQCAADDGSAGTETTNGDGDGDGDGDGTPSTLELELSQVKQFGFSWAPVDGAEFYRLLERAQPDEPYVEVGGDVVGITNSLTVPLHFRANASYKLRICDNSGCVDSDSDVLDVEGSLVEAIGYFKASNTDAGDKFGWSVALSGDGNTLAVAARSEASDAPGIDGDQANNSAPEAGAVYVFVRNDEDAWSQQAYVKASNPDESDWFGHSLALSTDGTTLVVGAPLEDSGATGIGGNQADDSAESAGAVYVFVRDDQDAWSQQAYVKASNSDPYDRFGWSVAASGDGSTLAVGAYGEDSGATGIGGDQADVSTPEAGAVYVFVRDGQGAWSQQAYVKASNSGPNDWVGYSVALSGDGSTLVVGAAGEASGTTGIDGNQTDNSATGAGAVYVFVRDARDAWSQQAYVKPSNSGHDDWFGYDVALSGDGSTLVVGANLEDSSAMGIDGDQADNSAIDSGAAYVFVRDQDVWSQQMYVKASNSRAGDRFGQSVALSGDGSTLAVGADREGSSAMGIGGNQAYDFPISSGAVYVFVRDAGDPWSQRAYVKASNTTSALHFGTCVALNGDGSTLAVGATNDRSSAFGISGSQNQDPNFISAGAVYLY